MSRWQSYLAVLCLSSGLLTAPVAIATTGFPQQITLENHRLERIGLGTARYAGVIRVYEAALYAPAESSSARILDVAVPKRLEIVYRVSLEAGLLAGTAQRILERQHDAATLSRWQPFIDRLHAAYRDVSAGDRLALAMAPKSGVWLEFNGRELIRIDEPEFGRVYFGIWLGDAPLSASLRDALLSRDCCRSD